MELERICRLKHQVWRMLAKGIKWCINTHGKERFSIERKEKSKALIIFFSIVLGLLLATNIFTVYLLINAKDSFNSKNQALAESKGKIELLQKENKEVNGFKEKYSEALKDNKILDGRVGDLTKEVVKLNDELDQKQTTQVQQVQANKQPVQQQAKENNPSNAITVGSSKDHVRQVMGNPDSILLSAWWYGKQSWVSFDSNGLVDGWYNGGDNLKTK